MPNLNKKSKQTMLVQVPDVKDQAQNQYNRELNEWLKRQWELLGSELPYITVQDDSDFLVPITTTLQFENATLIDNGDGTVIIDMTDPSAGGGGENNKVGVDGDANPQFLGSASNTGVLRSSTPLTYTDGGDFITLAISQSGIATDGYLDSADWNTFNNKAAYAFGANDFTGTGDFTTSGGVTAGTIVSTTIIGTLSTASQPNVNHDSLLNFVANEHINHSSVDIIAGTALTGGGDITASRTLNVDIDAITTLLPHNDLDGLQGGDPSTSEFYHINSLDVDNLTTLTDSSDADSLHTHSHTNLTSIVANEHINHSSVNIIAGNGLSGGGDITTDRTLNVNITEIEGLIEHNDLSGLDGGDPSDGEFYHISSEDVDNLTTLTDGSLADTLHDHDHNVLTNTHNLTTDIDHDTITNNHNLTTDIDHDLLTNYIADEHVAHSGVILTAGIGLDGGGDITSNRIFDVNVTELEGLIDHNDLQGLETLNPSAEEYFHITEQEAIDLITLTNNSNADLLHTHSHTNLEDLTSDDHLQYLLIDGTRAMTGNLDMGTNDINNVGTISGDGDADINFWDLATDFIQLGDEGHWIQVGGFGAGHIGDSSSSGIAFGDWDGGNINTANVKMFEKLDDQLCLTGKQGVVLREGTSSIDEANISGDLVWDNEILTGYTSSDFTITANQGTLNIIASDVVNISNDLVVTENITTLGKLFVDNITSNNPSTGDINILDSINLNANNIEQVHQINYYLDGCPDGDVEGETCWNIADHTLNLSTGLGPVLQVGQELHIIVYNNTGETIPNGSAVYPIGGFQGRPSVALASAETHVTFAGDVVIATMDIPDQTFGITTKFGNVRDIDASMWNLGDTLWLSADTPGELTNVKPEFPDYVVQVGGVVNNDAVEGALLVEVTGKAIDTTQNFWNGVFRETINFTISVEDSTIIGTLNVDNGHNDMTMMFSDGFTMFNIGSDPSAAVNTIELTAAGSDDTPVTNYIYITKANKILENSTASFPFSEEHIKVAQVVVQTASTVQTVGALRNQNWNDHVESTVTFQGHLPHITEKLRQFEAQWDSGTEGSIDAVELALGNVYTDVTSGVVYQLHRQTFESQSMPTDDIHIVNNFASNYAITNNLNTQILDANGDALSNRSFSFVIWGVMNRTGQPSHVMCNLPTGSYLRLQPDSAIEDASNFSVYQIPKAFQGVGFLIARFTFQLDAVGTDWTLYDTEDLRGRIPNSSAGGGSGGGGATTFLGLTDTPVTYVGEALKIAQVDSTENFLEFTADPTFTTATTTGALTVGTTAEIGSVSGKVIVGDITGNARGATAIDMQSVRTATQVASGANAVAFGRSNTASATAAVAIGRNNNCAALYSAAIGITNATSGGSGGQSAFGSNNTTSAEFGSAFGTYNTTGDYSRSSAFGNTNTSNGTQSSAFGYSNSTYYYYSNQSAFGSDCSTQADKSSAFGYACQANNTNASAFGYKVVNSTGNSTEIGINAVTLDITSAGVMTANADFGVDGHMSAGANAVPGAANLITVSENVETTGSWKTIGGSVDWEYTVGANTSEIHGDFKNLRINPAAASNVKNLNSIIGLNGQVSFKWATLAQGPASVAEIIGVRASLNEGVAHTGAITDVYLFKGTHNDAGTGGTVTNMYGLHLQDIDWATNNWAIKTGTGLVEFGDELKFTASNDSASVANEVSLGGYDISAGNRVLAVSQESAVVTETDETKFSHKMPIRINGTTYYMMLTTT